MAVAHRHPHREMLPSTDQIRSTDGQLPSVVLTGRPNTGKSTIFNRIVGEARAVVGATAGITRDRLYAQADWTGVRFAVTDTGGLGGGDGDPFAPLVAEQAQEALRGASVIVVVVDCRAGLLPADREIAERVRRLRKPVVLVANKADRADSASFEFYDLGLGDPIEVSATRGEGLGEALDAVVAHLAKAAPNSGRTLSDSEAWGQAPPPVPVAFVGRPNVGKSSLVNRLLGEQRLIVSDLAGTTRDAVDVPWESGGRQFTLVDTPGLRKPARIDPRGLEHWMARRSTSAIGRADVAVLVLDATQPCTEQDKRIAGAVTDRGRAAVVALNKADLVPPGELQGLPDKVRLEMPFLHFGVCVACSAVSGRGLSELPAAVASAADSYHARIPTSALNQCIRAAVAMHPPATFEAKPVRIYYAAQIGTGPPTVALVVSRRGSISDGYVRYLENRIRERFELSGTPVRWVFRERAHRRLIMGGRAGTP